MNQYKVTLNFTFTPEQCDVEEEYDDDGNLLPMEEGEDKEQYEAFQRTEAYFAKNSVENHVRQNYAMDMVESILCDGDVVAAEWDKKKFAIHMVVNTDHTKEDLIYELEMNSLEDGEYEACGDTGWIVMTRGPKNEQFAAPWDTTNFWVYGLTDYRNNPIEVTELGEALEVPPLQELVAITEKGRSMYEALKKAKETKTFLTEEQEQTFKLLCRLMGDKRLYGKMVLW
jgi:hypothetical protein